MSDKPRASNPLINADDAGIALDDNSLSSTVGAFQGRIKRKKREKAQENVSSAEDSKKRHALMLDAIVQIRKSLVQVARIDLGDRFSFELDADDFLGWPRIIISLIDEDNPKDELPALQVSAHDRNSKGIIEIRPGDRSLTEKLSLARRAEIKRLPSMLKKCVRVYLDLVEKLVIELEEQAEYQETEFKEKSPVEFEATSSEEPTKEISGDLFAEEERDDFLETLPKMEEVDTLSLDNEPSES